MAKVEIFTRKGKKFATLDDELETTELEPEFAEQLKKRLARKKKGVDDGRREPGSDG